MIVEEKKFGEEFQKKHNLDEILLWPKQAWAITEGKRSYFYILGVSTFVFSSLGMLSYTSSFVSALCLNLLSIYSFLLIFYWQTEKKFDLASPFFLLKDQDKLIQVVISLSVQMIFAALDHFFVTQGLHLIVFVLSIFQMTLFVFITPLILIRGLSFLNALSESIKISTTNVASVVTMLLVSVCYMIVLTLPLLLGLIIFMPGLIAYPYLVASKFLKDVPLLTAKQ